jgi:hypothetical protein
MNERPSFIPAESQPASELDPNAPAQSDRTLQRLNRVLSATIACAVLGVGGVMAYQNLDSFQSFKMPDRNALFSNFLKKKLPNPNDFKMDGPGYPQTPDWDKVKFDPSFLENQNRAFNDIANANNARFGGRRR